MTMQTHIKTRRPNKWPTSSIVLKASSLSLIVLILVSGIEAIVKQQPQQQQRNDDTQANSGQQHHQQSAYNNHQSPSGLGSNSVPNSLSVAQSPQPSYSSSVSISSSSASSPSSQALPQQGVLSNSPQQQQQQGPSNGIIPPNPSQQNSAINQQSNRGDQLGYANYASASSAMANNGQVSGQKPSSYLDNMSAAASNTDQSYQAAANSVNMALANSGIFGSSPSSGGGYNPAPQNSASSQNSQQSGSNSPQSLNPLHYFYYPAKDSSSSSSVQAKAAGGSSMVGNQSPSVGDMMSNSASNNYQSMAYPTYADQLNSALSNMGSGPEAAASSQDASYLPQPGASSNNMGGDGISNGQQASMYNGQQQQVNQQQNGIHQSYTGGDLNGYASNINPAQSASSGSNQQQQQHNSISFNGPSSVNGMNNGPQPSNDYMNSHMGGSGHQQVPPMSAYQNNLYNQIGDLSTSNFGNNAGGLSSVASYMSPNQQHVQSSGSQHDLFSNSAASLLGASGQQFNSAASQLSPAAVSPPVGINQQQGGSTGGLSSSSLFNAASSLFGQQSAGSGPSNSANNLFSSQHYLNSFLSPQQYGQIGGQQPQLNDQPIASASSAQSSTGVASGSSSKRFGISSFIMPMLALAGLSLLIPTMSNIGTAVGRKKRSIEDRASASNRQQQIAFDSVNGASQLAKETSIGEYMDKIERYYSIYKNAVENDDCLNRLICEFGDAVKDLTGKSAVVTVIEKLVPNWMTGKMHLFKEAALDNKEGKEKCKKYICHSNKHH